MRSLLLILLGAVGGAALFHAYYLMMTPQGRCGWDHPFDDPGKASCIARAQQAGFAGYGKAARHQMDHLIGTLER